MHIDSHFDSGNIEVIDITDDVHAKLRIRKDAGDEHMQWFYFRVDGAAGKACTLQIINAGDASYPRAWNGYRVCTSVDRENLESAATAIHRQLVAAGHDTGVTR